MLWKLGVELLENERREKSKKIQKLVVKPKLREEQEEGMRTSLTPTYGKIWRWSSSYLHTASLLNVQGSKKMSSETQSEKGVAISSSLLWYSVRHREGELGLGFSFKIVFYLFFSGFLGFNRFFFNFFIFIYLFIYLLATLANERLLLHWGRRQKAYAAFASEAPQAKMCVPFVFCVFFSNAFGRFQNALPQSTPQRAPRKHLSKLWL